MTQQVVLRYVWGDGTSGQHTCNNRADAEKLRRSIVAHAASTKKKVSIDITSVDPSNLALPPAAPQAQPLAARKPHVFIAALVFVVLAVAIGVSSNDSEPRPTTPQNREECERAYEGVGDGTVDWRGICPVMRP
ncbi:hypothetical protein AB0424_30210 [Streptomyces sp. NPDC051180]|uniref:hypothetical protein n=1 Tax=Streptomyces sp. NPDC051180 TaxID=3155797 RepID=UPI00344EDA1B